ncbi:MAG: PQQ-dependent sugar dehydrogenase [Acidobacteriota bacterium]
MARPLAASCGNQTFCRLLGFAVALAGAAIAFGAPPAARALGFELVEVADGLDDVVAVTSAGDERLFLVSKEGRVWILDNGAIQGQPFLDIRDRVLYTGEPESEQGLLSVAFHPDYAVNGFLYVGYVARDGDAVLARFSESGPNPDQASSGSERVLLRFTQPGPNHNINHLAFGPDGMLYAASGDGGYQPEPRCTPQEGDNFLGKILRLDVDQRVDTPPYYAVPADNPFVGPGDPLDEIWALGLRNPWRFSFDRQTGDLHIADVGHRLREEVNFLPAGSPGGQNWGFKMMEGFTCRGSAQNCTQPIPGCNDPAYTPPVIDYGHDATHCAIIGGFVYRGNAIPQLRGAYLHGDYCGATGLLRRSGSAWTREELTTRLPRLLAFGEDANGEPWALAQGVLYRIVDLVEESTVSFAAPGFVATEDAGSATVTLRRERADGDAGGSGFDGAVAATVSTVRASGPDAGVATAGADYVAVVTRVEWADGDGADKTVEIPLLDDLLLEGSEVVDLALDDVTGPAVAGLATSQLRIVDDEAVTGPCVEDEETLCLRDGRFALSATWRDFEGNTGNGRVVPNGTAETGLFWFFGPLNWELMVKVLDGCDLGGHYWVFSAATTNVEYSLTVLDTETGVVRRYDNPLGVAAAAITDTAAFATCP